MGLCVFLRGCSGFFQLIDDGFQLGAVSCDHTLLRIRDFDDDGHLVAVAGKQGLAALELGDAADLRAGEFQNVLDVFRFLRLQVQDDFRFTVIEDGAAILAALEVDRAERFCSAPQAPAP